MPKADKPARVELRLPRSLHDRLVAIAASKGISLNALILEQVEKKLTKG